MAKYIKAFFIFLFLSLIGSFSFINFIHSKMEKELYTYLILTEEMKNLNDTYIMCKGLLSSNPSEINIKSCNLVFEQIKGKTNQIKDECPYINFYITYINEI